jgi:hypothetical protein
MTQVFQKKENPTKCLELILKRIYSCDVGGKYEKMEKD